MAVVAVPGGGDDVVGFVAPGERVLVSRFQHPRPVLEGAVHICVPCCGVRAHVGQCVHLAEGLLLRPEAQAGGALVGFGVRKGLAYCVALASFGTPRDADLLAAYLDRYLRRPDLGYDQIVVMGRLPVRRPESQRQPGCLIPRPRRLVATVAPGCVPHAAHHGPPPI
ncbi:DUF6000 family protein [Streptomyces goshikiensis]|uniref:DUF6000 family protein n=1 Tax=Streptomyces goshikiensis TaxID=1942 RepID=UPI00368CC021